MNVIAMLARVRPAHHGFEFVFVHPFERDDVDFHGEARALRSVNPREHAAEIAAPGDRLELGRIERIERNVDPADAATREFAGEPRQLRAVRGQRDFLKRSRVEMSRQRAEKLHDVPADEGLAAGNPDLARPHRNESRAEPIQFFKRQELAPRQERHLFRHAVGAAKIATVRHRHANVSDGPSKRVDEGRAVARPDGALIRHVRSHLLSDAAPRPELRAQIKRGNASFGRRNLLPARAQRTPEPMSPRSTFVRPCTPRT